MSIWATNTKKRKRKKMKRKRSTLMLVFKFLLFDAIRFVFHFFKSFFSGLFAIFLVFIHSFIHNMSLMKKKHFFLVLSFFFCWMLTLSWSICLGVKASTQYGQRERRWKGEKKKIVLGILIHPLNWKNVKIFKWKANTKLCSTHNT